MFSLVIVDFEGFLNKKQKLTIMDFKISFMKAEKYCLWRSGYM